MLLLIVCFILPVALSTLTTKSASTAHTLLERLDVPPPQWKSVRAALPAERLVLRVALRQHKKTYLEDLALNVSNPRNAQYGKYLAHDVVSTYMRPQIESSRAVSQWLQDAGLPENGIKHTGNWIFFQPTVLEAEQMLKTKFSWYRNTLTNTMITRTLEYSVPKSLLEHVDFIYPSVHFSIVRLSQSTSLGRSSFDAGHSLDALRSRSSDSQKPPLNATFCNHTITPECLKALYNVDLTDIALTTGENSKLAICGFDKEYAKYRDLGLFQQRFAPYTIGSNFSLVSVNGGILPQNDSTDSDAEANVDIQ